MPGVDAQHVDDDYPDPGPATGGGSIPNWMHRQLFPHDWRPQWVIDYYDNYHLESAAPKPSTRPRQPHPSTPLSRLADPGMWLVATTTEMLKRGVVKGQVVTRVLGPAAGAQTQVIVDIDRDDLSTRQRLTRPVAQAGIAYASDTIGTAVGGAFCGVAGAPTAGAGCVAGAAGGFVLAVGTSWAFYEAMDWQTDNFGAAEWAYGDWYDD